MSRSQQTTRTRRRELLNEDFSESKLTGLVQIYQELLGRTISSDKQLAKMGLARLKQLAQKLRAELYGEPEQRPK